MTVKLLCSLCHLSTTTDKGGKSACCHQNIAEVLVEEQNGFRTAESRERLDRSHRTVSWIRCPIGLIDINDRPYFLSPMQPGVYRLRPVDSNEVYIVRLDFQHCNCRDARHRPRRPGGCKHVQALTALLGTIRF